MGAEIGAAGSRLLLRVPVTISSDAASRIAAVSARVTSPMGVLIMLGSRWSSSRVVVQEARTRKRPGYAGIGIAMVTLIESTVSVTTRQSDNAPIASEAAMTLVNREDATGARRL